MMQLVLSLALALGLFFILYVLVRRNGRVEGSAQAILEARQALLSLQMDLLPSAMLERIFEKRDLEYVIAHTPGAVQELFFQERQRIAISWITQIRKQILSLKQFHLGSARFYSRLSLKMELRLAAEFFLLLTICRALEISVRWRGPYAAPRMVGRTAAAAARVCSISEKSLDFLKVSQLEPFGGGSLGNPTLP